jgi:predicted house-cleaning NTP pyrophosphatase (Maf/HAM1 superfamily)
LVKAAHVEWRKLSDETIRRYVREQAGAKLVSGFPIAKAGTKKGAEFRPV